LLEEVREQRRPGTPARLSGRRAPGKQGGKSEFFLAFAKLGLLPLDFGSFAACSRQMFAPVAVDPRLVANGERTPGRSSSLYLRQQLSLPPIWSSPSQGTAVSKLHYALQHFRVVARSVCSPPFHEALEDFPDDFELGDGLRTGIVLVPPVPKP